MLGTAIAIGLGLAAGGTAISYMGAQDNAKAQRRAERIRERQMRVQTDRERRQAIRQAMQARAQATTGAVYSGAMDGSGIAGGQSQIISDAGRMVADTNTNESLGSMMFAANAMASKAQSLSSIGQAVGALGGTILGASGQIGRVANTAFNGQPNIGPWSTTVYPTGGTPYRIA